MRRGALVVLGMLLLPTAATAQVRGEPIACVVLVTSNAAGQTQNIVASYRPRSSLLLLSGLSHEKLAGTPYREQFATGIRETSIRTPHSPRTAR